MKECAGREGRLPVKVGTNVPQSRPLVKDCHFGVSLVNYSDSDSGPLLAMRTHYRLSYMYGSRYR